MHSIWQQAGLSEKVNFEFYIYQIDFLNWIQIVYQEKRICVTVHSDSSVLAELGPDQRYFFLF